MRHRYILKTLKSLNQRIIVTFHGIDIQIDKNINYGYRLNNNYEIRLNNLLNNVVFFFHFKISIKIIELGVQKEKIVSIPNGIDIKNFQKNF